MTGALDGRWKLTVRKRRVWQAIVWRQYQDPETGEWAPSEPSESAKPCAIALSREAAERRGREEIGRRTALRWRCQFHRHTPPVYPWDDVRLPGCSGQIHPHHRRKASSGGAWSIENLITLCDGHNGWIEDEPDDAALLVPHLVIREGDDEYESLGRRAARYAAEAPRDQA